MLKVAAHVMLSLDGTLDGQTESDTRTPVL